GQIVDDLARAEPRLHVLHRSEKRGLGTAYIAGFCWALERDYEYIFEMDADFSHDPADLLRLRGVLLSGEADASVGSRWVAGGGTRNGFRVAEVPIVFVDRRVGKSKMGRHIVTEAMLVVLRLRLQTLLGGPRRHSRPSAAGGAPAKYSRTP